MFKTYQKSFFIIIFLGVLSDQITKHIALNTLENSSKFFYNTRLGFDLAFNSGSAFSLFENSTIILSLLSLVIAGFLVKYYPKCDSRLMQVAFNLIITGALGNIVDRIFRTPYYGSGHVVDFIVLWQWPTFNIADSFVSVGVVLAILSSFFVGRTSKA